MFSACQISQKEHKVVDPLYEVCVRAWPACPICKQFVGQYHCPYCPEAWQDWRKTLYKIN